MCQCPMNFKDFVTVVGYFKTMRFSFATNIIFEIPTM